MKNFAKFLFLLFIGGFAQNKTEVQCIDAKKGTFLKNVLVYNFHTKTFNYSTNEGKAMLEYTSLKDSVLISKPGYEKEYTKVLNLKKNDFFVKLKENAETLDSVFLTSENRKNLEIKLKGKHKNYINSITSGVAIASLFELKKHDSCQIESIKFHFGKSSKTSKAFVRPLILLKNKEPAKPINILERSYAISLENLQTEHYVNLKPENLLLKKHQQYLIGIEVIQQEKEDINLPIQLIYNKKYTSFMRYLPVGNWVDMSSQSSFSINYELLFSCP